MSHALAEGSTPDREKTHPKRGKSLTASMILSPACNTREFQQETIWVRLRQLLNMITITNFGFAGFLKVLKENKSSFY